MNMYTGLARIARKTGYPVIEVPGWETRTRPQAMSDVRTITCHHTAGPATGDYPSYNTVLHGRGADLPGPLAQYGIGRSGTIYVFAAGSANHAGVSRSVDYEKTHAIGIEAEAVGVPGTKGDWPEPQMDAYAKLCRALIDEFGLKVADVLGHKETCAPVGRKTDPSFDMQKFRTRVAAVKLPVKPADNQEEDNMALSESDVDKIVGETASAVWNYDVKNENPDGTESEPRDVKRVIVDLEVTQDKHTATLASLVTAVEELKTTFAALIARLPQNGA